MREPSIINNYPSTDIPNRLHNWPDNAEIEIDVPVVEDISTNTKRTSIQTSILPAAHASGTSSASTPIPMISQKYKDVTSKWTMKTGDFKNIPLNLKKKTRLLWK